MYDISTFFSISWYFNFANSIITIYENRRLLLVLMQSEFSNNVRTTMDESCFVFYYFYYLYEDFEFLKYLVISMHTINYDWNYFIISNTFLVRSFSLILYK